MSESAQGNRSGYGTSNGIRVTEEMIQQLAARAEQGYDLDRARSNGSELAAARAAWRLIGHGCDDQALALHLHLDTEQMRILRDKYGLVLGSPDNEWPGCRRGPRRCAIAWHKHPGTGPPETVTAGVL